MLELSTLLRDSMLSELLKKQNLLKAQKSKIEKASRIINKNKNKNILFRRLNFIDLIIKLKSPPYKKLHVIFSLNFILKKKIYDNVIESLLYLEIIT